MAGDRQARRPASGITIDPEQLTRMRDLVPVSREGLAERAGELLFDRDAFASVMDGRAPAGPQLARALWLALGCGPADIIRGLPARLRGGVSRWMRGHPGQWSLDIPAVDGWAAFYGWSREDLAAAVAKRWFSRDAVNKIERGERRPRAETLAAFCQVLGCTPADLMPGSRPLPDGTTRARRERDAYNKAKRAWADENGFSYRTSGRVSYPPELDEAYAKHLAGQQAQAS